MSYRRKRYYRRGRRSTGVIKMKFQSFMDIATSDTSMQIITISAGGKEILNRCPAQFGAYKYYKIGGISVKLIPASTLPVDPSGLSYTAGANQVDPRDQLTPGMMRITNGEDVFENISGLDEAQQRGIYNNMLLDPRWFKWMLQSGVKRYATPRFWQIGQLHQDKWPGTIMNYPEVTVTQQTATLVGTIQTISSSTTGQGVGTSYAGGSSSHGFFQVGHSGRLGWLPTDGLATIKEGSNLVQEPLVASPLEVEVMKILLPRAFSTKYYYRMFITETVYFREPIVTMAGYNVYRPLDMFHRTTQPLPALPQTNAGGSDDYPVQYNGGNYGDR